MSDRVVRFVRWTLACTFVLGLSACGRSSLDEFDFEDDAGTTIDAHVTKDAGRDGAPSCGASSCPTGCCDSNGTCQAGTDTMACGSVGAACENCINDGFNTCDPSAHACGTISTTCDANTCPKGCCGGTNGNTCLTGSADQACGTGGVSCTSCAGQGETCDPTSHTCSGTRCGPGNCAGCCSAGQCVMPSGDPNGVCGTGGAQCMTCPTGTQCSVTGDTCIGTPTCDATTCPNGCCLNGQCVSGTDPTACGETGQSCSDCTSLNEICVPNTLAGGFCSPKCGADNCAGCCDTNGNCQLGTSSAACGASGAQCSTCSSTQACTSGTCQGSSLCNPTNCTGCCVGDVCAVGSQNTACGIGGFECLNCAGMSDVCSGGACTTPPCGPDNCSGCCANNVCVTVEGDTQCGTGGQVCADCTTTSQVCQGNSCQAPPPKCTAANCSGCCDPVQGCVAGFVDDACGSGGAACTDCASMNSTCDTALSPRVCGNQQTTCPATYPGCASGLQVTQPTSSTSCTDSDLENAAAACSGGPATSACTEFFTFEQGSNASCATCLTQFNADFSSLTGIFACVAPFVDSRCGHTIGCADDCETTSCEQCPSDQTDSQCVASVRNNQCSSYFNSAQCIGNALFGSASFCNPLQYNANYGDWLQGVGQNYCQ